MALAIRTVSAHINPGGGATVSFGFTAEATDTLVMVVGTRDSSSATNAPTGWTKLADSPGTGGFSDSVVIFARVAGSALTSATFDRSIHSAFVTALTGANLPSAVGDAVGVSGTHPVPCGSVARPAGESFVLAAANIGSDNTTANPWTPPAGYTERADGSFGFHPNVCYATRLYETSTAAGTEAPTFTIIFGGGHNYNGAIALIPALSIVGRSHALVMG